MQALKESKQISRRQPSTRGSNKGIGTKPGVLNESTVISATSSERTGIKPGVPDEEKDIMEEKVILEWGDEQDSEHSNDDNDDIEKDDKDGDADDKGDDHISDTQDVDDEDTKTESNEDDIHKYKIRVRKDEDEEMINAEVDNSDKGNKEITDATKADAEKNSEVKDDPMKTELPPSSSSISVSLGFGDQFLKLSSDSSLSPSVLSVHVSVISEPTVPTLVQESPSIATATTLPPLFVSTTPSVPQQTTTPIPTQPITTDAPIITTAVPKSNALIAVELRVAKLEKDMSELKIVDYSTEALAIFKSQVPSVVDNYLGSKFFESSKKQTPTIDLEQGSKKSASEILQIKREQAEKQQKTKFTIKSTDKAALEEYDLKSALYQSMHANKSFNKNHANHRLYHALIEALIEDKNAMDKGVADTVKDHKRKHDDDEDPPAGPNQGKKTKRRRTKESKSSKKPSSTKETLKGKAPTKGSKTGKSTSVKEPVEEPIAEVVMDDAGDDVAHDDNQPQDTSEPKTRKTLNPNWPPGHRTVAADYFFNNDLEYLKTSDLEVTYTSSIMKTKVARYEIQGIEDMVPTLWSTIKHAYDKDAEKGIKHREKIMEKRSDQQFYKFKEGDFVDLHLNDIEDMLLLAVQHKLFHLDGSVIVDFIMALRMFTRSLILKRRKVELKEPYTPSYDPPGIFYKDLNKQKRVLRADELYKFSDGTIKCVRDKIHHRVLNFRLDYNTKMPKRKWTAVDRKRSGLMIELIDKQLREREIIINLERLVGARELEMDYKIMTCTV
ncbi:hypothetical protein Tco_0087923 [Tanacetum coccineum]